MWRNKQGEGAGFKVSKFQGFKVWLRDKLWHILANTKRTLGKIGAPLCSAPTSEASGPANFETLKP
jgi:hypothetical protein